MEIKHEYVLRRITSTHNRVRTDEIRGYFKIFPKVGFPAVFVSDPIDKTKDYRKITTSVVQNVEGNQFTTMNSVYEFVQLHEEGIL